LGENLICVSTTDVPNCETRRAMFDTDFSMFNNYCLPPKEKMHEAAKAII